MEFVKDDIPASQQKMLARAVFDGLGAFYSDPENRKKFEEWKQERDRKNVGKGNK